MKKRNNAFVRWGTIFKSLIVVFVVATSFLGQDALGQDKNTAKGKYTLFKDAIPSGARWTTEDKFVRDGGDGRSKQYIYLNPDESPAELTGLSIKIRENPGPGEYRYITFRWIKWGGEQIGIKFTPAGLIPNEKRHNFTYVAGKVDSALNGLQIDDKAPGNWTTVTRDLYKDFGNFTLSGITFVCPERRDAGFDDIFLGQSVSAFENAPAVLPTKVAAPVTLKEASLTLDDLDAPVASASVKQDTNTSQAIAPVEESVDDINLENPEDALKVDWGQQISAGGVWMYPIYALGFFAIVITILRLILSRRSRLAPKKMRNKVREALAENKIDEAVMACEEHPSTLGESLKYIFEHRNADRDIVSQVSGDMAGREIREQLDKIYPLSVVASLGPLLGLLGTIVGMIEAFGLVAIYGDEGGPSLLSNSISLALITTAAGLVIAIPAIAIYFYLKRSIKGTATIMEEELEHALTMIYLRQAVDLNEQKLLKASGDSVVSPQDQLHNGDEEQEENFPFDNE